MVGIPPVLWPLTKFVHWDLCALPVVLKCIGGGLNEQLRHCASEDAEVVFTVTLGSLTLMTLIPSHSTRVTLGGNRMSLIIAGRFHSLAWWFCRMDMSRHSCVYANRHHPIACLWKEMNELEKNENKEEQIPKAKCQHFRKWEGERLGCVVLWKLVHGGEETD